MSLDYSQFREIPHDEFDALFQRKYGPGPSGPGYGPRPASWQSNLHDDESVWWFSPQYGARPERWFWTRRQDGKTAQVREIDAAAFAAAWQ